mgnify:CR=1 FL=1
MHCLKKYFRSKPEAEKPGKARRLRDAQQLHAKVLKMRLKSLGMPIIDCGSHIVPVHVGHPVHCKALSDLLLEEFGVYVQPINFPTVPRGTERLRFTPGPSHDEAMMRDLTAALVEIWDRLELRKAA